MDLRLSDKPVADPARGGLPRFVLIARLAKVEMLNGSEISTRERKESEIRYVHLVMSKLLDNPEESKRLHPRFIELKNFYGIEDEMPSVGAAGPQKMASGFRTLVYHCETCGPINWREASTDKEIASHYNSRQVESPL